MNFSNVKLDEERDIVATLIVRGGCDNAFAGTVPGYLITQLEKALGDIMEYQRKRNEKLSESDGD